MSRILFVGDLQIGSGQHYGTAERTRLADQAEAWRWIVEQAVDRWEVDQIVLLGDVFDKRHPTPDELLAFARPLRPLRGETTIDVLAIAGNHDVSAETAATALEVFKELVDVHRTPGVWGTIATLPWTPPHRLAAAQGREQINERVALHLVECARELRGSPPLKDTAALSVAPGAVWPASHHDDIRAFGPAPPSVLALHWSISGGVTASGVETINLAEPVLPLEALVELGYRFIVAGHIHKTQVLAGTADGPTTVIVAGSPIVSDFGEAGGDHGVWVIDTETRLPEFYDVPDRPFVTYDVDFTDGGDFSMLMEQYEPDVAQLRNAVVRVRYTTTLDHPQLNHAAIEHAMYDAGAHKVFSIEPTILRERRARVETMEEAGDPLEALDAWMDAQALADMEQRFGIRAYTAESLERA